MTSRKYGQVDVNIGDIIPALTTTPRDPRSLLSLSLKFLKFRQSKVANPSSNEPNGGSHKRAKGVIQRKWVVGAIDLRFPVYYWELTPRDT